MNPGPPLTDAELAAINAKVLALPPLSDEEQDALGDLLLHIRLRARRERRRADA